MEFFLNFQYKDDPLFVEFLETHTGNDVKAVWKNDIDISAEAIEKSDDESRDKDDKDDDSKEDEDEKEEEKNEGEEKIANKVISDLEV